jgi:hypothetical protein
MSTTAKISIAIIGAFLAVVIAGALGVIIGRASASPAAAPLANVLNPQQPQPPLPPQPGAPKGMGGFGKITAVGADSITVEMRDGRTVTVQVDENTKYNRVTVAEIDLAGLQVGDTVAGPVQPRDDGAFYTPNITVVPEQFPEALGRLFKNAVDHRLGEHLAPMFERMHRQWHQRMEGEAQEIQRRTVTISAIDGNVLTVTLRDGSSRQIAVADDAVIRLGRDPQSTLTLADLQVGQVIITDAPLEAENPIAHRIIVRPQADTP